MRKVSRKRISITAIFFIAISGCGNNETKTIEIDHHVFIVPKRYLLKGKIPWLPVSQHDGLTFYANPEAPLPDRNSVLIQSTTIKCPPNALLGSNPLASACRAAAQKQLKEQEGELEKVHPYNESTQWEYRVKNGKNQGAIVATCSAMTEGNGICYSFGVYENLVYSFGLRDSEIEHVSEIKSKINELLYAWELRELR